MAFENSALNIAKRKRRRRRLDKLPLAAHLVLDELLKGQVGILSEDLFADLFPGFKNSFGKKDERTDRVHHVAITPRMPLSITSAATLPWTILPVRRQDTSNAGENRPHASIRFPAASLALQSFAHTLTSISPNKSGQRFDVPIEIHISDVVPLGLDTVFVSLDTDALKKLDDVQAKFGGGFDSRPNRGVPIQRGKQSQARASSQDRSSQREKTWKEAVREALRAPKLVHEGDLLPLPLPSHPITHVSPPPAKITFCEPVSQGLLLPSTKIVIVQSHTRRIASKLPSSVPVPLTPYVGFDDGEDTSNEQFYSAAEDRNPSQGGTPPDEEASDTFDSELSTTDADDLSDDSEDMISLDAPLLPPHSSGVLSSFSSATPRPGGFQTNGVATPGSVFSSFTATTIRGPSQKGKVFKAQGLLEKISDELIHPKPSGDEDEEARVFVDTTALVKVGCFSGDWVKLESYSESNNLAMWGSFGDENGIDTEWRAAKIYGLPEIMTKKAPRYPINKLPDRRSSFFGLPGKQSTATVYISPMILANLGDPTQLKISPLTGRPSGAPRIPGQKPRITGASLPPLAKEVTLMQLSTPLSTERVLQPSLFTELKTYFERKRRLVKNGDLVGITVDEALGRAVYAGSNAEDETSLNELLKGMKHNTGQDPKTSSNRKSVAWFKVGNVITSSAEDPPEDGLDGIWGGMAVIDVDNTTMDKKGNVQGKLPPASQNSWSYYLGVKKSPKQALASGRNQGMVERLKPYTSSLRRRLRELISAATSPRAIHLGLPPLAILLTSTQRQIGKGFVATQACEDLGLHTFPIDAFDILTDGGAGGGDVKTVAFLETRAERALSCGAEFTALLIKHIDALSADRMTTLLKEILGKSRVLIATTTEVDKVPEGIRGIFSHEIEMMAPDEGEREGILQGIVEDVGIQLAADVDLSAVAVKTAALVAGDLVDVVDRAMLAKRNRLEALAITASKSSPDPEQTITIKDIELAGGSASFTLAKSDFDAAVDAARKNFADAIGAPKIPNVSWSDVGGLTHVKDAVMETIQLPLSRPELFTKGMKKRSGILFYGPPGTGKTLLAKAIATEFSLNFFSVKGPELLNMYIGESEANVRRVFQRARDARPCVVFFDELDSVAPKRGNQGDSGGVMDRIVSQLLAELDGMSDGREGAGGVFVIGATNRPDLLDQALLRPGRFDKMLYLGVSDTHEKQQTILEALTRKFSLDPSLSLRAIASTLPFTYTGADLYALCSDAMLKAITRQASAVDKKVAAYNADHQEDPISIAYYFDHFAQPEDITVEVTEADFMHAKNELVPSVSMDELKHYERVRRTFEGQEKAKAREREQTTGLLQQKDPNSQVDKANTEEDEDSDEYLIRTDNVSTNGSAISDKSRVHAEAEFGEAADGDEDMYT
ncbi:AAA-domain-containing protein, partial [Patellaria atrata CBS 101060]